jgi:ribosome-associated protein
MKFQLSDEYITLQNLLKLENSVSSGGEAKYVILGGLVRVNGEIEQRRGKKLRKGDTVVFGKNVIEVE